MFHPTAAGMVYSFAGSRFAFSMAFYNFGGTLAFGLGPVFITLFCGSLRTALIVLCRDSRSDRHLFHLQESPSASHEGLRNFGFIGSLKEVFGGVWKSVILDLGVGCVTDLRGQSFLTFIPVLFSREGYSWFLSD